MIVDKVSIHLKAGKGGNGSNAFVSKRGMRVGWGGNGSKGADIVLRVSLHIYDLSKFRAKNKFKARNGNCGMENNKSGRAPDNLVLYVPDGTFIRDIKGNIIYDMNRIDNYYIVAKGGLPGKGNYKRRYATEGRDGEEKDLILDYRIPNDVAIIGLPNSGKTSLFNSLTGKHYKIGEYPFTTTVCAWSQFEFKFRVFTILDMPALIDKSNEGKGIGNKFLKHLYRTKIVFVIADAAGDYMNAFDIVKQQIALFDPSFMAKKVFYLLTKTDKIKSIDKVAGFLNVSVNNTASLRHLKELIFSGVSCEEDSNKSRK